MCVYLTRGVKVLVFVAVGHTSAAVLILGGPFLRAYKRSHLRIQID